MTYYNKNLKPNEVIIEIIKKYFLTYFWQIFFSLIFTLLPFFLLYLLFQWGKWGIIIFSLLLTVGLFSWLRFLIIYYFNNLIITNQRLIYYQQSGLFHRKVFEVFLDKIQDISYEINGFWPTLLKYGTLNIQIINSNTIIKIDHLKSPAKIQNLINSIKESLGRKKNNEFSFGQ